MTVSITVVVTSHPPSCLYEYTQSLKKKMIGLWSTHLIVYVFDNTNISQICWLFQIHPDYFHKYFVNRFISDKYCHHAVQKLHHKDIPSMIFCISFNIVKGEVFTKVIFYFGIGMFIEEECLCLKCVFPPSPTNDISCYDKELFSLCFF